MKLTVIGTGYLGATHAAAMAELGHEVLGLDVDQSKVDRLNAGDVPFFEPGLPELLQRNLDTGRLRFTTSYGEVGRFGDVHFICVGTPQKKGEYAADMALRRRRPSSRCFQSSGLVRSWSASPPSRPAPRSGCRSSSNGPGRQLVWNPEFLREGFAVQDTLTPDRIVMGAESEPAAKVLCEVYQSILDKGTPLVITDFATAELVKVAANSFLATKISFINAMAEVCEATGADVTRLTEALVARRPDRWKVPARRARFRRRLPAQGHPGVHGPSRRTRRRPGPELPEGGRRDQPPSPGPDGRPGSRVVRRQPGRDAGGRARRGVQTQQRRHP